MYSPLTNIFLSIYSQKDEFNAEEFQTSYKENSSKEKLVLAYAENFRRQYVHLYRDRKPLFLNPMNEVFTEVIICSLWPGDAIPHWLGASLELALEHGDNLVQDCSNFIIANPQFYAKPSLWSCIHMMDLFELKNIVDLTPRNKF